MKEARGIYRVRRIGGLGSDARVTDGATDWTCQSRSTARGATSQLSISCLGRTSMTPRSRARSRNAMPLTRRSGAFAIADAMMAKLAETLRA
jgi:hypothetical protein